MRESPNFPGWRDFALVAELPARTGRAVLLDNDANAVILGEASFGVARGSDNVIGYTLGTGVGGGIVLGGKPYRGERGMAAELGHTTVEPRGRPCGCGNHGCLEQYAGTSRPHHDPRATPAATWRRCWPTPTRRAPSSWPSSPTPATRTSQALFADVGRCLGQAAAAMVHTLDITTIVLAGGIAGAFRHIAPAMHDELVRRTFRSMSEGVRILEGSLGARAGVLAIGDAR